MKTAKLTTLLMVLLIVTALAGDETAWGKAQWNMSRAEIEAAYSNAKVEAKKEKSFTIEAGELLGVPYSATFIFDGPAGALSAVNLMVEGDTLNKAKAEEIMDLYRQKYGSPVTTTEDPVLTLRWHGETLITLYWEAPNQFSPARVVVSYEPPKKGEADKI